MSDDHLPVRYHLEIYEGSFNNAPTISLKAGTPFMSFHIGDFIDPKAGGFSGFKSGMWLKVESVVHWLWKIDSSHIGQKVGLCVAVVPSPGS